MNYILIIRPVLEVLALTIPVLFVVAFVTVAERKTMASMQRRLGPNVVGYFGLLQAFADALKLLLKEYVAPSQSNLALFFLGPVITLIFSLLVYAVVPYGPGLIIYNSNLGILYLLALSSISTYGILLAGWSANSKYAFLGSLRSTAQLISYELILTSAILLGILFTGSLNLIINVEAQRAVWFLIPLLPVFIIFFVGSVAETNRAPFDLAEAESELVSGFMTEHAAVIFVFFFLAEYASIVFICILVSLLFLGGYLYNYISSDLFWTVYYEIRDLGAFSPFRPIYNHSIIPEDLSYIISLGIKASIMVFTFIWVRASFPRIRYDQLMSYCWTILLPIVIAFIIYVPCILQNFDVIPVSATLIGILPIKKVANKKLAKNNIYVIHSSFNMSIMSYLLFALSCKYFVEPTACIYLTEYSLDISSIHATIADNPITEATGSETVDNGNKPTDTDNKPTEGGDKPTEGGDKPTEGGDKPTEGVDKPAEGGDKPTEGGDKPAKTGWLERYFENVGGRMPPAGSGWGWGM